MNILAIETSTEACSVGVLCAAGVVERFEVAPRRHAELVLPMTEAVLSQAGLARSQLDAIAFGRGPGAFTGVRLAVSVAQGLALGLELPLVPVSTLAALALDLATAISQTAHADAPALLAVLDARMGEIYAGCFACDGDALVSPISEESVGPASALVLPHRSAWVVGGSGWAAYEAGLQQRLARDPAATFPALLPHAASIARLALRELRAGRVVDAAHALPVYLRDKVALTLVEQRART